MPTDIGTLASINIYDIAQIDILIGATAVAYGVRGYNGVILVYTKDGKPQSKTSELFNIKTIVPLGYQQPAAFYAPKYDTPARRNVSTPDLRTTIHWQPVVTIDDEGVASFEFYTTDDPTSYSVVIEGLSDDGTIIRREEKLWQKDDRTVTTQMQPE